MKYKVGDKVKIITNPYKAIESDYGIVIKVYDQMEPFAIDIETECTKDWKTNGWIFGVKQIKPYNSEKVKERLGLNVKTKK